MGETLVDQIENILRNEWGDVEFLSEIAQRIVNCAAAAYEVPEDCIRLRGTIKGTMQEPGKPIQIVVCVRNDETSRVALARMDSEVNVDGRLQAMKCTLDDTDDGDGNPDQMDIEDALEDVVSEV